MCAHLALIGGEEFSDGFEDVHAGLLADLGSERRRVVYLPTCAADDGDEAVDYWCTTARDRLSALGASVDTPRIIDAASANDVRHAQRIAEADWIYLGGGYPHVAMRILANTRSLDALSDALARGALITGASAGAMMMGARSWVITPELAAAIGRIWETGAPVPDLPLPPPLDGLGIIPRSMCWPHFNRVFSMKWLERGLLPAGFTLIGIDEQTALVSTDGVTDGQTSRWEVRGRGSVTIIRSDLRPARHVGGDKLLL